MDGYLIRFETVGDTEGFSVEVIDNILVGFAEFFLEGKNEVFSDGVIVVAISTNVEDPGRDDRSGVMI